MLPGVLPSLEKRVLDLLSSHLAIIRGESNRKEKHVDYMKREIFALGCGIYEVMAWKVPFPEMTEKQIKEQVWACDYYLFCSPTMTNSNTYQTWSH